MIRLKALDVQVGGFRLTDIHLEVPYGAYAVLMGPSACGKTTVLEAICGLRRVLGGRITLCGRDVTELSPARRGVGLVPQDGALFLTMNVFDQLALPLKIRNRPRRELRREVEKMAETLGITSLLKRPVAGLSGGERQRIALGRALIYRPPVLCLDEPLAALDEHMQGRMIDLLREVHTRYGVTTLHVTHSRSEARQLADVLLRFEDGGIIVSKPADPADTRQIREPA